MTVTDGLEARQAWLDLRQAMRCQHRDTWDAEYRALMGERVMQTGTPSMAVVVNTFGQGKYTLTLPVADPVNPRIDTVCQNERTVQVITGTPAFQPVPPRIPAGFAALAHIRIMAGATSIHASSIEGAKP